MKASEEKFFINWCLIMFFVNIWGKWKTLKKEGEKRGEIVQRPYLEVPGAIRGSIWSDRNEFILKKSRSYRTENICLTVTTILQLKILVFLEIAPENLSGSDWPAVIIGIVHEVKRIVIESGTAGL
jgi:hypothetical protein